MPRHRSALRWLLPAIIALLWLGLAYGLVDALLLTVLPVSAVWLAFREHGLTGSWTGKVAAGAVGLIASMAVTAIYHLGYVEFRGDEVVEPVVGSPPVVLRSVGADAAWRKYGMGRLDIRR